MMNLIKTAFVHGLQRSLVSTGAMPPYGSELQMKIAANYALKKLALKASEEGKAEKDPEEMSEDEVSEVMTGLVEDGEPGEATVKAIKELEDYAAKSEEAADSAEELAEGLAEAIVADKSSDDMDKKVKEAMMAVHWLKRASADVSKGPKEQKVPTLQADGGERAAEGYADLNSQKKVEGTAADTTEVRSVAAAAPAAPAGEQKVSQVQSAIDLLRKLAETEANSIQKNQPDAQSGLAARVDPNPQSHLNGIGDGSTTVLPLAQAAGHESTSVDSPMLATDDSDPKHAALAYLVQKTASEVGHFLPQYLSPSEKLAALRTMVGMNGAERAHYIGRIKEAAEGKSESFLETPIHEKQQNKQIKELKQEVKALKGGAHSDVESGDSEEKKAALILRRLGIGA